MAQNSIRSNITKEDIIAEIRLALNSDFSHSLSIVIVEGADDVVFFNGKLHQNVEIIESFSGKIGVNEIVAFFDDDRVIGICDRDYNHDEKDEKILYYDYSCLEMMMVSIDSAFNNFVYTYYQGKTPPQQVRLMILKDLQLLSVYRQLNAIEEWGVRFIGLSISKAFDKSNARLNYASIFSQLKNNNPELVDIKHTHLCSIRKNYMELSSDLQSLLSITNGHDFMHYFHALCCCHNPKYKTSVADISRGLESSFRADDFKRTNLYNSIIDYQSQKGITIINATE